MFPQEEVYGGWPASGEIDIMESRGNDDLKCDGVNIGHQQMGSTLHWGPDAGQNRFEMTSWLKNNEAHSYGSEMHIYELIWNEDGIAFKVDGEEHGSVYPPEGGFWELGGFQGQNPWAEGTKMAPFDEKVN